MMSAQQSSELNEGPRQPGAGFRLQFIRDGFLERQMWELEQDWFVSEERFPKKGEFMTV